MVISTSFKAGLRSVWSTIYDQIVVELQYCRLRWHVLLLCVSLQARKTKLQFGLRCGRF